MHYMIVFEVYEVQNPYTQNTILVMRQFIELILKKDYSNYLIKRYVWLSKVKA
jgi:hypothetical protein